MKVMDKAATLAIIFEKDCDASGSTCQFFDLGDGTGVKVYENKNTRDRSHTTQKYVHKFGLAPEVGKKINFEFEDCDYYGYFTEVVSPLPGYGHDNAGPNYVHDMEYVYGYDKDELDQLESDMQVLLQEFEEKTGFTYMDDHTNNFGLNTKNEMKIIDFDVCYSLYRHISK